MKILLVGAIVVHGLIHFPGVAKAFGLADLPQLTQPISRASGFLWLAAGLGMLAAGGMFGLSSKYWWAVAGAAVVLSQSAIFLSWSDAKFGTLVNIVILLAAIYGFAAQGPWSFSAEYLRDIEARVGSPDGAGVITEADLTSLPTPVQRYLRFAGVIGTPKVQSFRASWRGRIRGGPQEPWMNFVAEQENFVGEPARFFHMRAKRGPVPIDVLHRFTGGEATMRVRVLSLIPVASAQGREMTQAETVTLFNDLCILAPGALIDPEIRWEMIDESTVRAHYTVGENTISAVLSFGAEGELKDFVSDDRLVASPDGSSFTQQRWSTPTSNYRTLGGYRVGAHGEGVWHAPEGQYVYIDIDLTDLEINPTDWKP